MKKSLNDLAIGSNSSGEQLKLKELMSFDALKHLDVRCNGRRFTNDYTAAKNADT